MNFWSMIRTKKKNIFTKISNENTKVFFLHATKSTTWKFIHSWSSKTQKLFYCFPIYGILWFFFHIHFQFQVPNIEKEIIILLIAHFIHVNSVINVRCTLYVVTCYEISNFKGDASKRECYVYVDDDEFNHWWWYEVPFDAYTSSKGLLVFFNHFFLSRIYWMYSWEMWNVYNLTDIICIKNALISERSDILHDWFVSGADILANFHIYVFELKISLDFAFPILHSSKMSQVSNNQHESKNLVLITKMKCS